MTSVEKVRRLSGILFVAVATFLISSPTVVSGSTTTTTTTVPVLCPPAPLDPTVTTVPLVGCVNPVATTTTTTTTTTLPVAATTVPEGCALPPVAQAVFKGTVTSLDTVSAVFAVQQLRAGSLDGYASNNEVSVRYGSDAKYLEVGQAYLVGVAQDSVTLRLTSTLRDQPELEHQFRRACWTSCLNNRGDLLLRWCFRQRSFCARCLRLCGSVVGLGGKGRSGKCAQFGDSMS